MVNLLSSSLPAIIDIVVVLIILLFMVLGFAKGFINTFLKSFGTIISLIIAVLLCATVANFLSSEFSLQTSLANKLIGTVNSIFGEELMARPLETATESSFSSGLIAGWIIKSVLQIKDAGYYPVGTTLGMATAQVFAYYVLILISFVILFIILKILCFLLEKFALKLHKRKIIGLVDRIFGIVLGLIRGLLFVQIVILTIQAIPIAFIQNISSAIESSVITAFISDINIYGIIIDSLKNIVIK